MRIKSIARDLDMTAPSCFISYAWGERDEERWVGQLGADLRHAGIDVVLDQSLPIGTPLVPFIERIDSVDFVALVGTPRYLMKYKNREGATQPVVVTEFELICERLVGASEARKSTVLPLLVAGDENTSFPPLMRRKLYADFRDQASYFPKVFDLALTMYRIDLNAEAVADVRETLARS